jgi:hypothetical protein
MEATQHLLNEFVCVFEYSIRCRECRTIFVFSNGQIGAHSSWKRIIKIIIYQVFVCNKKSKNKFNHLQQTFDISAAFNKAFNLKIWITRLLEITFYYIFFSVAFNASRSKQVFSIPPKIFSLANMKWVYFWGNIQVLSFINKFCLQDNFPCCFDFFVEIMLVGWVADSCVRKVGRLRLPTRK